ncbi:MAG: polysaccharide biosynthesis protein [Candidatus Omnitrophica bacterium]|nr:polysaccharide biosynthesis protein [Candidatus Omnitrophota bacterium]
MTKIRHFIHNNRRAVIITTHIVLAALAYFFAFLLRFEFAIPASNALAFYKTLPLLVIVKIFFLYRFRLFSGLWKYVSVDDLWRILKASVMSSIVFVLGVVFVYGLTGYPRSVFILDWVLYTFAVGGIRFFNRLLKERVSFNGSDKKARKAIIIGAGEAGVLTLRECRKNAAVSMEVVGFVDDDPSKRGEIIQGIKVVGSRKDIPSIAKAKNIEEIVIAMPSAKGEAIRDILSYCEIPGVNIKIVPGFDTLIQGKLELKPRAVKPEDLLGREKVDIDTKGISAYLKGKRVLVTGAGGSIGSELCRQIARFEPEKIVLFDHNENDVYFLVVEFKTKYPKIKFRTIIGDVRDVGLLKRVFSRFKPHVVFHAAAHKHVPLMEENAVAAVKNNIIGSMDLIYAASHYNIERFVLISTDKAVNPVNIMGMSKRIAEIIMQAKAAKSRTKFMAVRFGNVLGSAGSVVPLFKRQIEEGGPVTITHPDARRYFMSVGEAVALVLQAGAFGSGGEIFILDMGEQIKIADIAKNLISLSGLEPGRDIEMKFVGLREGEKLKEDILLDKEKHGVTRHDKIFVTKTGSLEPAELRKYIKELHRLSQLMDEDKIVTKMKEIIKLAD